MPPRVLTALPVFNEARHLEAVLRQVRRYSSDVLVVDDGSSDGTAELLANPAGVAHELGIEVLTHKVNQGYGAALRTAFAHAIVQNYELIVTIDCDGQHEPKRIPLLVDACQGWDIVSGSRYLARFPGDSVPPVERQRVNHQLTAEINRRLGLELTDAFCGFKAYRTTALRRLQLTETGYAMPLELWVQAAHAGLKIRELPVPLVYLDEKRSFGGVLDDPQTRLRYYYEVLDRAMAALEPPPAKLKTQPESPSQRSLCGGGAE